MLRVYINSSGLVTPVGSCTNQIWNHLIQANTNFSKLNDVLVGQRSEETKLLLEDLRLLKDCRDQDDTILLSFLAAKSCIKNLKSNFGSHTGVLIGSSRGLTSTLESLQKKYFENQSLPLKASPLSTSGNLATFLAQQFGFTGFSTYLSSACTTSMQSLGTAFSLIKSEIISDALVGGVEAANTNFTLDMLKSLKIVSTLDSHFPHQSFGESRKGMVLGEGAAMLFLQKHPSHRSVEILGFGSFTEKTSATGVTENGLGLQQAIEQALKMASIEKEQIDLIVGHGSATIKGDLAEWNAYQQYFGKHLPLITAHKWLTGHMLGASALYSVALACEHIHRNEITEFPYNTILNSSQKKVENIRIVLVCSLGFGGQASVVILKKTQC